MRKQQWNRKTGTPWKEDEIVVYCSDANCIASRALGQFLERNGYTHVLHFAGGLQEWEQAGYPLEGTWVQGQAET